MNTSRIPAHNGSNQDGVLIWFSEMSRRGLLFHPEEAPESIVEVVSGRPLFTDAECREVGNILDAMFAEHGSLVIELCYPIFMSACGQKVALDS
ncbi:hypothetical protein [Thermomonas sp.]|jgi:hypothetical protein|uniref:hypothetical protein n=1 Tax=Thermomonas sp. TaxID=1971895 RepID=UPI002579D06F|nr:hypothetical protein [Thermomonas sp.]